MHAPEATGTEGDFLAVVDGTPASYLRAARRLEQSALPSLRDVRVGVLSTFTFDMVLPYLKVEGARRKLRLGVQVAPFGQLEQQAFRAESELYMAAPEVVVLAARVEDVARDLAERYVSLTPDDVTRVIADHVTRIVGLARAIRERSRATLLVFNQAPLHQLAAGIADASLDISQSFAIAEMNRRLTDALREVADAHVFDVARLATQVGLGAFYDMKLQHLARVPHAAVGQQALGKELARYLKALYVPARKCLVLDLDNTLWGGVLGEDGLSGIALGEDMPGSAFKTFQRYVAGLRARGVLLALASKNNEGDAKAAFGAHPDMVLRWTDFAAHQVHWNDKASSMRAIAAELNVGLDALVFFDDHPAEREWVRRQEPSVLVIDAPKDPLRYGSAVEESGAFDQLRLTGEDRKRAQLYLEQVERKALAASATSVEEFLQSLAMRVTIGSVDKDSIARVVQLLGKTNQFNVTTRRHSEADLTALLAHGAIALWMRVEDRYGDNGLVGVAIAVPDADTVYRIDTFLMSCRVLGRRVEHALTACLARRVHARGGRSLLGEFIPTEKNAPAASLFADVGFRALDRVGFWQLGLAEGVPALPSYLEVAEVS